MVCRLCLCEYSAYLPNETVTESEIAKIIAKYFQIEITEDMMSKKICTKCWTTLYDFEIFCLSIENKQEALKRQLLIKEENVNGQITLEDTLQLKNIELFEPQIDTSIVDQPSPGLHEFEEANEDENGENSDDHSVDVNYMPVQTKSLTKTKSTKRNQSKALIKSKIQRRSVRTCVEQNAKKIIETKKSVKDKSTTNNKNLVVSREMDTYLEEHATLSCCLCSLPLQNFDVLKKHFRLEHQCVGYMQCCKTKFRKRYLYVDHLKWHDNPELFKCKECDKILVSRNNLENHMATLHPQEKELKFLCSHCPRKFAKQYILDLHIKSHLVTNNKKDYVCEMCQKCYRTSSDLKGHEKRVHQNGFVTMCDICGKNFQTKQGFKHHMASVHQGIEDPEAQCDICQRWLKDKRSLYKHMYKHRDEQSGKQYFCPECGIEKPTRQTLNSHIRYHHSKKFFNCTLCDKVFKLPRTLEEHIATHTGEDLYTCAFCPQTFKSHANMHNHKKKMHPNDWVRKYTQPSKPAILADH